jgi:hypothetical protein
VHPYLLRITLYIVCSQLFEQRIFFPLSHYAAPLTFLNWKWRRERNAGPDSRCQERLRGSYRLRCDGCDLANQSRSRYARATSHPSEQDVPYSVCTILELTIGMLRTPGGWYRAASEFSRRLVKMSINTTPRQPRHVKNPGTKRRINDWLDKYHQPSDKDSSLRDVDYKVHSWSYLEKARPSDCRGSVDMLPGRVSESGILIVEY